MRNMGRRSAFFFRTETEMRCVGARRCVFSHMEKEVFLFGMSDGDVESSFFQPSQKCSAEGGDSDSSWS